MRSALILATVLGFAGTALAADGPTMDQCKGGWKAEYSKMWTEMAFKTACDSMMMKKPMGTSDPATK
ncbi:MAG: hypothetical protein ABI457_10520 [Hyphomicrobium sp.]|jgi:hypothetical protein